ncbi:DUF4129 domain-containing protein [Neorhodopirellula pilleata]|uniref:Protein-glutamine gamma-glutamyltransferase-like C-terminal domain-containing protein n=1 Tax=Neorhodopirellula pilleata TaxID=2714738 RepID=A0A5C6AQF8_9BACT|nr:DUF4129 domain-containing protein [Neorhodopirellula pilleata]TWU01950.1 hypothetical protein Pla100_16860 [Neorhodopirellula pilleata]
MFNRRHQTVADYAAIGLAPVLIFAMLLSLAMFLMMVIYSGYYPARVAQTLFFYTMGVTAIARMTIEEGRNYSMGYTIALGAASFFVMSRFFGGPLSSAVVLFVIGYLADRIVHDCTIVDDGIDSSGQGLIDSGRLWFQKTAGRESEFVGQSGNQPGRTVLYLALGALPLFGIGQFFLASHSAAWTAARSLLAIYLFTSLSLLVVTAFLNLRRYLRQRNTEMPWQTTVAWVAGGMGMIGVILLLSLLAPMPGRTLASLKMPEFLKNAKPMTASRYGYGNEGAEDPGKGSSSSQAQSNAPPTPEQSTSQPNAPGPNPGGEGGEKGAPPGGEQGDRQDGPTGNDPGGKQGKSDAKGDQDAKTEPSKPSPEGEQPKPAKSDQPAKPDESKPDESKPAQSTPQEPAKPGEKPKQATPPNEQPDRSDQPDRTDQPDQSDQKDQSDRTDPTQAEQPATEPPSAETQSAEAPPAEPPPAKPPAPSTDWGGLLSGLVGLFKYLLIAVLFGIVGFYLYRNYQAILAWINEWLGGRDRPTETPATPPRRGGADVPPPRPFSSFENPIGRAEPQQVVVVTFQALEAWAREQGVRRSEDETPNEFAHRLVTQFPVLRQSALSVVDAYNRIVYGQDQAASTDVQAADQVWKFMRPSLDG